MSVLDRQQEASLYCTPQEIGGTNLKPDLLLLPESQHVVYFLELTVKKLR